MKDWLTVIIVLLIIAIVLDGVRRMRLSRRENIRLSKNAQKADAELDSVAPTSSSEFPSGGARIVSYRDEEDALHLNESVRQTFESGRTVGKTPQRIPEQVSLNLETSVPMLMDSVESVEASDENADENHYVEEITEREDASSSVSVDTPSATDASAQSQQSGDNVGFHDIDGAHAPKIGSLEGLDDAQIPPEPNLGTVSTSESSYDQPEQPYPSDASQQVEQDASSHSGGQDSAESADYHEPDEVLIMNVMAKPGTRFSGADLLATLMEAGLKFGDMNIFHRHHNNDGDAPILYSLANMVVPGTFNLATMNDFETPGVSLFLSLPVVGESLAAYNDLAQTARFIADQLDGELKDENRSVMTSQTVEHGRQRVIEYERKKKLTRA